MSETIHLKRPILPSDLPRMHFHARLVKEFTLDPDPQPQVYTHTLDAMAKALKDANIPILLPNINQLSWKHSMMSNAEFPYMHLFLGPCIQRFSTTLSWESIGEADPNFRAGIIQKLNLPTLCPSLHTFRVETDMFTFKFGRDGRGHQVAIRKALSDTVQRWSNLHVLSVPNLTPEAFIHVARLPHLRLLDLTRIGAASPIKLGGRPLDSSLSKSVRLFPALRDAAFIQCGGVEIGAALLGAILCAPRLVELRLNIEARVAIANLDNLLGVITTGHTRWHESLECLNFSSSRRDVNGTIPQLVELLTIHALRPLFIFANLSVVMLALADEFSLTDEELQEIGKAWPRLAVFALYKTTRCITLKGVMILGQCCPSLKKLSIEFDGSVEAVAAARSLGEGAMNNSLVTLDAGLSPVGNVDEMADVLVKAFPNLTSVMGATEQWLEIDEKVIGG